MKEFKENGNTLSEDIIEELNDLKESKDKKFNVYIQEIVASNSDDKEIKVPDEKFIILPLSFICGNNFCVRKKTPLK